MDFKSLTVKLPSGDLMPMIALGTYQITGSKLIRDVLDNALAAGYRSIDTAALYHNESEIGVALKELLPKYNLKREDLFIITKLSPSDQGDKAKAAIETSLQKLDCGYLDLYLIHWPGQERSLASSPSDKEARLKSWEHMVNAHKEGLIKNIGVSNYNINHLQELLADSYGVKPSVNQVEWHPHYHQDDLKNFCNKEDIILQAYSSLGGSDNIDLLKNSTVVNIAKKLNKEPAQVLLRWAIQQNVIIVPKARSKEHLEADIDLNFVISEEDMTALNNFKEHKYSLNPAFVQ